jgi:hypothetical protein
MLTLIGAAADAPFALLGVKFCAPAKPKFKDRAGDKILCGKSPPFPLE